MPCQCHARAIYEGQIVEWDEIPDMVGMAWHGQGHSMVWHGIGWDEHGKA